MTITRKPAAQSTSARVLDAARKLLHHKGVEGVSMRAVADAVGVTPMALYRHFDGRTGLLNALADEGFNDLARKLAAVRPAGDVAARLQQLGSVFVNYALKFPHLYDLMFLAPRRGARTYPGDFKAGRSRTFSPAVQVIEQAMRSGELRHDDAVEIAFELSALSHGLIVLYRGGRLGRSVAQFRTLYRQSFRRYFHALRP